MLLESQSNCVDQHHSTAMFFMCQAFNDHKFQSALIENTSNFKTKCFVLISHREKQFDLPQVSQPHYKFQRVSIKINSRKSDWKNDAQMWRWECENCIFSSFFRFAGKTYGDDGEIWVLELHSAIITSDNSRSVEVRVNFCSIWRWWWWGREKIEFLGSPKRFKRSDPKKSERKNINGFHTCSSNCSLNWNI